MDAMFFIVLIGLSVTLISEYHRGNEESGPGGLAETSDTVFTSSLCARELGYRDDEVLNIVDLTAISLMKEDGLAGEYIYGLFSKVYRWDDAISMTIIYEGHEYHSGTASENVIQHCSRTYDVQYGGSLLVEIDLNG